MDRLLRFGYGNESIVFEDIQASIQPDFGDIDASSVRLATGDGGIYKWGYDRAFKPVATVQAYLWLIVPDQNTMAQQRRELDQLLTWGPRQLVKQFQDGRQVWTWAALTNIEKNQSVRDVPHRNQRVQLNFHVPRPYWFGKLGVSLFDNPDSILTDGLPTVTPNIDRQDVGDTDMVQITNNGTAPAGVYIRWEAPAGVTITNPKLTRQNNAGQIVDSIEYTGTMNAGDVVDIDGRNHLLQKNSTVTAGYWNNISVLHGRWMEIPPGTWTLTVAGTFSGGDGKLTVDCWDTYN